MRPTSLELVSPLLAVIFLAACPSPPSSDDGDDGTSDGDGDTTESDDGPVIVCTPGDTQCKDSDTLEVCEPTGLGWEEVPCEGYEECDPDFMVGEGEPVAVCVGPCEKLADSASSEGCSFYTTSMYQASLPPDVEDPPDAIVIGNPQLTDSAIVELYWIPTGSNQEELVQEIAGVPIENPVEILAGESHVFQLDPALTIYQDEQETSLYRSGSVYHVVSNLPVVAYLHSPFEGQNSNASTLLLPENVLQRDYVIFNHGAWQAPNYFIVIAMEDQTTVTWRPSVETAGDELPLPFVEQGETGEQLLNRFDNMRIDTSAKYARPLCERDLSGTVIQSDKPIWVVSAIRGLRLPWCGGSAVEGCPPTVDPLCNYGSDFAMEQNLPLDYWGREYVGAHSPLRNAENHYWRVYAGEDDVTVTVTPAQPGTPINLASRGDWQELVLPPGTHVEFDGDGVFMPVQFVSGHYDNANDNGSPAMVQMVPTAQFLNRYVFVTAFNYPEHYVQVIRPLGGADILLDGTSVGGWEPVGEYEVATQLVDEGEHEIISDDSFGIMQYGYSPHVEAADNSAGYGYMGGMKAEEIFIP